MKVEQAAFGDWPTQFDARAARMPGRGASGSRLFSGVQRSHAQFGIVPSQDQGRWIMRPKSPIRARVIKTIGPAGLLPHHIMLPKL